MPRRIGIYTLLPTRNTTLWYFRGWPSVIQAYLTGVSSCKAISKVAILRLKAGWDWSAITKAKQGHTT